MPVTSINHRLIDIFTFSLTSEIREFITQEFCKSETRLIASTSAFRIGVDFVDISRVIHWGPPSTLEELTYETRQAGRPQKLFCTTRNAAKMCHSP